MIRCLDEPGDNTAPFLKVPVCGFDGDRSCLPKESSNCQAKSLRLTFVPLSAGHFAAAGDPRTAGGAPFSAGS